MIKQLTSNTSYLLCVRLYFSVFMWPSSGPLANRVQKSWLHIGPDDGHIRTETCSLTHNKYDVLDLSCFIILILNFNTSGCLQSKSRLSIIDRLYIQTLIRISHSLMWLSRELVADYPFVCLNWNAGIMLCTLLKLQLNYCSK
jgi:hypothetical protein